MLISFEVENYRAFADRAILDLARPGFSTVLPRKGQAWGEVLSPVAGVFGANASGKSTLIDAIETLSRAVRDKNYGRQLYQPSLAVSELNSSTEYAVHFVAANVRYSYVVRAQAWGVEHEELYSYEKRQPRKLFARSQAGPDEPLVFAKGSFLRGPSEEVRKLTTSSALYLAVALDYGHHGLAPVAKGLALGMGVQLSGFDSRVRSSMIEQMLFEMIADCGDNEGLVEGLLRVADVGIDGVVVKEEQIPPGVLKQMQRFLAAFGEEGVQPPSLPDVMSKVLFVHRGVGHKTFELSLEGESVGTQAWLVASWQALKTLKRGGILLIDELDASLHPSLVRYVVELFLNPDYNRKHAQIIFTTHDSGLLSNAPLRLLDPTSVWFTEKDDEGRAELFSLADYPIHPNNNTEKRYLAGAYGAIPNIDDRLLMRWLNESGEGRG